MALQAERSGLSQKGLSKGSDILHVGGDFLGLKKPKQIVLIIAWNGKKLIWKFSKYFEEREHELKLVAVEILFCLIDPHRQGTEK